jgi:putative methylase
MQKRLVRKLDLETLLSRVRAHPSPSATLEQYTISADAGATVLYIAAYAYGDIIGRKVLDLGCGTGRLALGAAFLGTEDVVGVDVDRTAVKVALANSVETGLEKRVQWVAADISAIRGEFDTVLQNPPFGVQRPHADREFLQKALESARCVYSLHRNPHQDGTFVRKVKNCGNAAMLVQASPYLKRFIERNGGRIRAVYALVMDIPHMFEFHTKKRHEFVADLYVIESEL